ncbi:MAG: B12-binding domain-containing protein [Verrucomicrobiota bacterium]|nr:B12-binding domain-containing protein [Verrucomicrobiota bacterium]
MFSGPKNQSAANPAAVFEEHLGQLTALVRQRLTLELQFHQRHDLEQLESDLTELVVEFGQLLRVIYRYDLGDALTHEAAWFASVLAARGPGLDAWRLLLDSWVMAIEGVIKPPECNQLAAPLQGLRELSQQVFAGAQTPHDAPTARPVEELVDCLVVGDRNGAQQLLQVQRAAGLPAADLILRLILPAMAEIGRLWERNELAVFEEHLASETILRLLAGLTAGEMNLARAGCTAMVSCAPGDQHQILPAALTAYLELRGWNVRSLGRSLPSGQIALAAAQVKPAALFLSMTMLARLPEALAVVEQVRTQLPGCAVIVGGRGAVWGRQLLEMAGARVTQDFDEAHRLASGERLKDA